MQGGRSVTVRITLRHDETAVGGHSAKTPLAGNLVGQGRMKVEASARQGIERRAGAPVKRQKSARLAGCCRGDLGPLDDDDVDPEATKEVGRAHADYASAADHNPHVFAQWFQLSTIHPDWFI
jgi:hypothetical protein